jgi:hypothetical protein
MAPDRHFADIGRRLRPSDIAVYGSWHDIPCSAENAPVAIFGDAAPLWLIELSPTEGNLSPLERRAITTTNVVIYDRTLEAIVAATLPLGGYAEPAASSKTPDQATERCLGFVFDGWKVTRLVEHDLAKGQRARRIRHLSERLAAGNRSNDLPVLLFKHASDGTYREIEEHLCGLDTRFSAVSSEERVTIVFGAISTATARNLGAILSNGRAG